MNSEHWIKCNFHAHTNAWNGLTNGRGTAKDIYNTYDSLGYGVYCVSDYQKINKTLMNKTGFIPAYEHGYGIEKTHQNVLGADKVCWIDFLLPQTLSNKQYILNSLSNSPENIIVINHPSIRNGYDFSDFKYLTNYNCMEVLNSSAISLAHWDSALSFGKSIFIVGSDDVHDVHSEAHVGKMCTWVNVSSVNEKNVLNALRTGRSYGMIVGKSGEALPVLKQFEVVNDTISIEMSKEANQITFTGQNGQVLGIHNNTSSAQYIFKPADHYARTHISYKNGTIIYLNPVFRYDESNGKEIPAVLNFKKTVAFRLMGVIILVFWVMIIFIFVLSRKRRKMFGKLVFPNFWKYDSSVKEVQ